MVKVEGNILKNNVNIDPEFLANSSGTISIIGEGSSIEIQRPVLNGNVYMTISNGSKIEIGKDCVIGNLSLHAIGKNSSISIGNGVGFQGAASIAAHETSVINIGDECLFASGCHINSSDVHRIYDLTTDQRINPPADIFIGRHVWLAAGVLIMKGTTIGEMSVVGTSSVVTGVIPSNTLYAGIPARLIRDGIYWAR